MFDCSYINFRVPKVLLVTQVRVVSPVFWDQLEPKVIWAIPAQWDLLARLASLVWKVHLVLKVNKAYLDLLVDVESLVSLEFLDPSALMAILVPK